MRLADKFGQGKVRAQTQKQRLLEALKNAGTSGVNSFFATYSMSIKQAPTRIRELKDLGFDIKSISKKDGSVNWVLLPPLKRVGRQFGVTQKTEPITETKKEPRVDSPIISQAPSSNPTDDWVFAGSRAIPRKYFKPEQLSL